MAGVRDPCLLNGSWLFAFDLKQCLTKAHQRISFHGHALIRGSKYRKLKHDFYVSTRQQPAKFTQRRQVRQQLDNVWGERVIPHMLLQPTSSI